MLIPHTGARVLMRVSLLRTECLQTPVRSYVCLDVLVDSLVCLGEGHGRLPEVGVLDAPHKMSV